MRGSLKPLLFFVTYLAAVAIIWWKLGDPSDAVKIGLLFPAVAGFMLVVVHYLNVGRQIAAAEALEDKKLGNARTLEQEKAFRDAAKELRGAAGQYYGAFAELESGTYAVETVKMAEDAMNKANGHVPKEVRTEWYAFWQAGRNIRDLANRQPRQNSKDMRRLWADHYVDFGRLYRELCDTLAEA